MSRFTSSANEAAAEGAAVRLFIAVDMDFVAGNERVHDGLGTITFGGFNFRGVGHIGGIELPEETLDLVARQVVLTVSGVDTEYLTAAENASQYQGRDVTLYLGLLNQATNELVDEPEVLWKGLMDQMTVAFGPGTGSCRLSCEHRLRRAPRIARYTHQDQQLLHPGDLFFSLLGRIQGFAGTWGAKGAANDGASIPTTPSGPWNPRVPSHRR